MRDELVKILNSAKETYPEMLDWVETNTCSTVWSAGGMSAYTTAPYLSELLGAKPGRFLKGTSAPEANRMCYFLDAKGSFICELAYAKHLPKKGKWITYRKFFKPVDEILVEYSFSSEIDGNRDAELSTVETTVTEDENSLYRYSLDNDGSYIETHYKHMNEDKKIILQKIWGESLSERRYVVTGENESLQITEISGDQPIQIFPEA